MKRILIIEDDTAFADLLKAKLSESYQVEICQDGQSGYYAIYEYKPDIVLLDLTIDQMDAVSLVGKMRVQKQFQKLPIFVLADARTVAQADDALAGGANGAFLKDESGSIPAVLAAISDLLKPSLARKTITMPRLEPAVVPAQPVAIPMSAPQMVAVSSGGGGLRTESAGSSRVSAPTLQAEYAQSFGGGFSRGMTPVDEDPDYQPVPVPPKELRSQGFLDEYGQRAHSLRQDFIRYRTAAPEQREAYLQTLLGDIGTLRAEATRSGLTGLSRYFAVIEFRVQQLMDTNGSASRPPMQGLATALDVLAALSNHLAELEPLNHLNPHALVVDDENVSRKALCLGLEKAKIKTTGCDNPDSSLLEAEAKPFDLIFLDVDLPKMNGFALCARIRIIPSHRKTPIIFVTSLNDVKARASSRVSGGNDFLTKPVNLSEVGINAWSLIIGKRVLENGAKPRA